MDRIDPTARRQTAPRALPGRQWIGSRFPLGDALEVYVRREDEERFIEEVRGDEPELAKSLRIGERELVAASELTRRLAHASVRREDQRLTPAVSGAQRLRTAPGGRAKPGVPRRAASG
jgi:hypothetical protein